MGTGGGRGVNLTTHLHLVPMLRMVELHFHSPIPLNGVVVNYLKTRDNVAFYPCPY
jgi:hypothetical protein